MWRERELELGVETGETGDTGDTWDAGGY